MSKQPVYTQEEIAILASNPFTRSVNENRLSFTVEFKQFLLDERKRTGEPWKEIFRQAGYDPELFGKQRMDAMVRQIRQQAASPKGLRAPSGKPVKAVSEKAQLRRSVRDLQEQIEILEQKIEFLKKTMAIDRSQELQKSDTTTRSRRRSKTRTTSYQ